MDKSNDKRVQDESGIMLGPPFSIGGGSDSKDFFQAIGCMGPRPYKTDPKKNKLTKQDISFCFDYIKSGCYKVIDFVNYILLVNISKDTYDNGAYLVVKFLIGYIFKDNVTGNSLFYDLDRCLYILSKCGMFVLVTKNKLSKNIDEVRIRLRFSGCVVTEISSDEFSEYFYNSLEAIGE